MLRQVVGYLDPFVSYVGFHLLMIPGSFSRGLVCQNVAIAVLLRHHILAAVCDELRAFSQVVHRECEAAGLWSPTPELSGLSVTVMVRTSLFPYCRSRLRNTTPSPEELFLTLAAKLREGLCGVQWVLPSLEEVQAACVDAASTPKRARSDL
jgi:hypothetical protein